MLCAVCDGHGWLMEPAATAFGALREACPACRGSGFRDASTSLPRVNLKFARSVALAERDGMNFERHAFASWLAARQSGADPWRAVGDVARRHGCVPAARGGRSWRSERVEAFERGRAIMRDLLHRRFQHLLAEFERGPPGLVAWLRSRPQEPPSPQP